MSTTRSFADLNAVGSGRRHIIPGTAGDYTRYIRMQATIAPYLNKGVSPVPNPLGWRSQAANLDARVVSSAFGILRGFNPNNS